MVWSSLYSNGKSPTFEQVAEYNFLKLHPASAKSRTGSSWHTVVLGCVPLGMAVFGPLADVMPILTWGVK